jgi:Raf kinase inhibitor-like YbhB/YbcL family protein
MIRVLGRMLRGWRPGPDLRVAADQRFAFEPHTIVLRSPAFDEGGEVPTPSSPPLAWSGVPAGTKMLALIVEDVDAPLPRPLVHAVAYDIDPALASLEAGALGDETLMTLGLNQYRRRSYIGPRPLPGHGLHRYVFTLLAASFVPRFDQPPSRGRLLDAIAGHVLALGELTGTREG